MSKRLNYLAKKNGGIEGMIGAETWISKNFDPKLLALVKTRASQINGCAFCLHMHREEALKHGEAEKRLLLLDAWRESKLFTEQERAALAWTESLTRITDGHASDADYEAASNVFSEDELLTLSVAIALINAWNRLGIGFRVEHPQDRVRAAS